MKLSLISGLLATFLASPAAAAAAKCRLAKPSSSSIVPSSSPSPSSPRAPVCDPGPNILTNPSFESSFNGWTPSSSRITINTEYCYPNDDSTFSNCADLAASQNTVWLGKAFVAEAGTMYTVTFRYKMGTPKPDTAQVNFYDNNALSRTVSIPVQFASADYWHTFTADVTFQSTSGSLDVRVSYPDGTCDFFVTNFEIVKKCPTAG